jgi:predicted TIM-barrel fold metal-dependent hydrolase
MFLGNAQTVARVILTGLCEQFPTLKWVSVESGAGWIPFILNSLDWQWKGTGAHLEYPNRLLPSEYFQRQIYGSFWFEDTLIEEVLEEFPDNIMFETDYPHPTSLSPGPASPAEHPKVVVEKNLSGLRDSTLRKVLHDTAATLYRVNTPLAVSEGR